MSEHWQILWFQFFLHVVLRFDVTVVQVLCSLTLMFNFKFKVQIHAVSRPRYFFEIGCKRLLKITSKHAWFCMLRFSVTDLNQWRMWIEDDLYCLAELFVNRGFREESSLGRLRLRKVLHCDCLLDLLCSKFFHATFFKKQHRLGYGVRLLPSCFDSCDGLYCS